MPMTCDHLTNGGGCRLHKTVAQAFYCRLCPDNTAPGEWPPANNIIQKARIGTRIAQATSAIGIKPCAGCKKRARILNGDA
jgi:hypothetical protein